VSDDFQVLVHQSLICHREHRIRSNFTVKSNAGYFLPVRKERQTADIQGFAQQCNVAALGSFTTKTDDDYLHWGTEANVEVTLLVLLEAKASLY